MASGQTAEHRRHGGHHDGAEPHEARLVDGLDGRQPFVAFGLQREIDHHDGILFDNANQQDDADEGHDAEVCSGQEEGEDRADTRRWERGENGQRVNQALVQDAENDIDGDKRSEDEIRLIPQRILKCLRGSLEGRVDGRGHAQVALRFFEGGNRVTQSYIWSEVEGKRDGRILALMIDRQRGALLFVVRNCRERNHGPGGRGN